MSRWAPERRAAANFRQPRQLKGVDALADRLFGRRERRLRAAASAKSAELAVAAARIASHQGDSDALLEARLRSVRDAGFPAASAAETGALLGDLALLCERVLGLRPHPVQLRAALLLREGCLVEMATGEGKSLVAALAGILAATDRRPCHIITVNDYLAQRDADQFHLLFARCGLRAAAVLARHEPSQRRAGHAADITYTTAKELLADFLRDRIALGPEATPERRHLALLCGAPDNQRAGVVLRGLGTAIVDEADSVLIDEAVTPLILSRATRNRELDESCRSADSIARGLCRGMHFRVDEAVREVRLTPAGSEAVAAAAADAGLEGWWAAKDRREELVERALEAHHLMRRDVGYVIKEGRIVIVDEFTGRLMEGRTWREGLHQAVEIKEGLEPSPLSETVARMSFQRFFRRFPRLCGMTGTAAEAADEFWLRYALPVLRLPTHRPRRLELLPPRVFGTAEEKQAALVEEIRRQQAAGRPVLVGLRSVAASETLSSRLLKAGIEHQVLNAVRHREEAAIIAEAGRAGRVTLATNLAGRGTDIRVSEAGIAAGGLLVIGTELHESARIDRQLAGRAGRQGDPGAAVVFLSAEDELLRRALPKRVLVLLRSRPALVPAAARLCQLSADYTAARARLRVLRQDEWLDEALSLSRGL